jgi:hypothetical protein
MAMREMSGSDANRPPTPGLRRAISEMVIASRPDSAALTMR